jgi:hypothetical protein
LVIGSSGLLAFVWLALGQKTPPSSVVATVQNRSAPALGSLSFDLDEIVRIGRKNDIREQFWWVLDVATDAEDNIYVLDQKNARIQIFDPAGSFVRTIGRAGQGPGEFNKPRALNFDKRGHLYVEDPPRVIEFDTNGTFVKSVARGFFADPSFPAGSGGFLAVRGKRVGQLENLSCLIKIDEYGSPTELLARPETIYVAKVPQGEMSISTGHELRMHLAKIDEGAFVYGYPADYELTIADHGGQPILRFRRTAPVPRFSDPEREALSAEGVPLPPVKPYFYGLLVDSEKRIYVQRNATPPLPAAVQGNGPSGTQMEMDVFNRRGVFLYQTVLPLNTRLIKNGFLYRVTLSDDGESEQVVKYRIANWSRIKSGDRPGAEFDDQPLSFRPSSSSWRWSTGDGEPVMRSRAPVVLGKGMTSRMDSSPARNMTRRSKPWAMPPCGGAP